MKRGKQGQGQVQGKQPVNRAAGLRYAAMMGIVVLTLAAVIGGGRWLMDPVNLPVELVTIEGEFRHITPADIETAISGSVTGGFLSLDVERIRRAAMTLPWVGDLSVRRVWPGSVVLKVTERVAYARWGRHELITLEGVRFTPGDIDSQTGLPTLVAPDGQETGVLAHYTRWSARLAAVDLQIDRLLREPRGNWIVQLADGAQLSLGNEHASESLRRLVRVYPEHLASLHERIELIDLRYTNGFAIQWREDAGQHKEIARLPGRQPRAEQG